MAIGLMQFARRAAHLALAPGAAVHRRHRAPAEPRPSRRSAHALSNRARSACSRQRIAAGTALVAYHRGVLDVDSLRSLARRLCVLADRVHRRLCIGATVFVPATLFTLAGGVFRFASKHDLQFIAATIAPVMMLIARYVADVVATRMGRWLRPAMSGVNERAGASSFRCA
jgi:hypothetical protein